MALAMIIRCGLVSLGALIVFAFGVMRDPAAGWAARRSASLPAVHRSAVNSIVVRNQSGNRIANYPLQFGRPFLQGAIAHAPQVLLNGTPLPTQADVKNRWPDGSVEYAVIAAVIPAIPAGGAVTLTFADTAAADNTPLSQAQMLDPSFNFDAVMSLTSGGVGKTASARAMLQNGDYKLWTSGPIAQTIELADDTPSRKYDIGFDGFRPFRPRFYATFWPATHQVFVRWVGENGNSQELEDLSYNLTLTAGSAAPATVYTADLAFGGAAGITGLAIANAGGYAAAYTGTMTLAGTPSRPLPASGWLFFKIGSEWLEGRMTRPNTVAMSYRARFGTTAAALANGEPVVIDHPKKHWAMSRWTRTAWLGGTPQVKVDIDNNLAYLASTRFLPSYDASVALPEATIAAEYALWTNHPHDLYDGYWDGGQGWDNGMGDPGSRPDIGPYPDWTVEWFYTGDWRMRQMALGMADLAAAWPVNIREGDPSKRLNRGDPLPAAGAAASGYGLPISITDRPTIIAYNETLLLTYSYQHPADRVVQVGPIDTDQPWEFEGSHEPSPFYPQYLLTGDPWYLSQMEMWAAYDAADPNGANTGNVGRGPTGAEGGISQTLRGEAWDLRSRAETAFIIPDNDPEKTYLTRLTNDALARWEGVFGIAGTPYDGAAMKAWGAATGNEDAENGMAPPLHNWQSIGTEPKDGSIAARVADGIFVANAVGGWMNPWMQWYMNYALGRVTELGFAADPLRRYTAVFPVSMVNDSGAPWLVNIYDMPTQPPGPYPNPTFFTGWPGILAALTANYKSDNASGATTPCCRGNYAGYLLFAVGAAKVDGYPAYFSAGMALMADVPGGAAAWAWTKANIYNRIPFTTSPKWAIVPRTDSNTLPAVPTAAPQQGH